MTLLQETEIANVITFATSKLITVVAKVINPSIADKFDVSDDVKKLLANALNELQENSYFEKFDKELLQQLLSDNIELICGWIFNPISNSFHNDDLEINFDLVNECQAFLNGLFNYIKKHKNEFQSIGFTNLSNQVSESTTSIRGDIKNVDSEISVVLDIVKSLQENQKSDFSVEFSDINSAIKERHYNKAEILLSSLSTRIEKKGTNEDKETLYSLYVNLYTATLKDDTTNLLSALDNLVKYTPDDKLRRYRETAKFVYENKYLEALSNVEKYWEDGPQLYSELKAFIFFSAKEYDKLLKFSNTLQENDKIIWKLRVYVNTQAYELGFNLLNYSKINLKEFDSKLLRLQVLTYYILDKINKCFNDSLCELARTVLFEVENLLTEVNEDTYAKSELLTNKMLLNLALGFVDYDDIEPYIIELDKLNCTNPNYLKNKGIFYLSKGEYEKAFVLLDDWCKKYPDSLLTKEIRAIAFIGYDAKSARKEFESLSDEPENLPIKIKVFDSYIRECNLDVALSYLQDLESKNIESTYIFNAYGDYYSFVQDFEKAFDFYIKALNCADGDILKIDIFNKALHIALFYKNQLKLSECSKYNKIINNKDTLHYYCSELIALYIGLCDFNSAINILEKYKAYSFKYDANMNYFEILCLFNAQRFTDVLKIYQDDNTGIADRRDINQKYKAYIISAINSKVELTKAKSLFKMLIPPENESETIERERICNSLYEDRLTFAKYCMVDLVKYPDSIEIMENFLTACVDVGIQNLPIDVLHIFSDYTVRYMKIPNDKKNGRLSFVRFKIPF